MADGLSWGERLGAVLDVGAKDPMHLTVSPATPEMRVDRRLTVPFPVTRKPEDRSAAV